MDELDLRRDGFRVLPGATVPAGVYVLLRGSEVLFVGAGRNVYERVARHEVSRRRKKRIAGYSFDKATVAIPFNHVIAKFCPIHEARILEKELIYYLRPKYNTTIPELPKDEGIDLEALAELAGVEWTEKEPWKRSSKDWSPFRRGFAPGGRQSGS